MKSLFGQKAQAENVVLKRLEDNFSTRIFAYSIDDIRKNEFIEKTNSYANQHFANTNSSLT